VLHAPQIEEPLDGAIIKTQDHVGAVPLAGGATRKVVTAGDYPDLNVAGVNILEYEGAGDIHIRGLGGGVLGQTLLILNNSTSTIWLYHNDPAAPGASRMSNFVLIGPTPIAPGRGSAQYTYTSGNYWAMTTHAQGDAIGQPYDPANYGTVNAGVSWTVEAVDALAETFTLNGRTLFYSFLLQNTAVSGVSQTLTRRLPYGWQARTVASTNMILSVDGGATRAVGGVIAVDPLHLGFQRVPADGWPVGANNITVLGQLAVPLD
jgi:hypothetical protein